VAQHRAIDRHLHDGQEAQPEVVQVLAGRGHQEGFVEAEAAVGLARLAAVVDRELQLVAVALDQAAEGDEAVEIELAVQGGAVGPHLGDDRAAGVGELHVEVALAVAVLAQLLLGEQGVALHGVARLPLADRSISQRARHIWGVSVIARRGTAKLHAILAM
jgi:hypothetical protein